MRRSLHLTILFLLLCAQLVVAQNYLPQASGEVVEHTYFTLSYIEEHEQAEWVYYTLTPASLSGSAKRKNDFRADGKVSTGSATLADYKGSGYDRGHLCPAASMSINDKAISESFYLSNMSPQVPALNQVTWRLLEENVRELALRDSILHVITGPILSDPLGHIGENQVTVPNSYYKVLYSPKKGAMVGYVMPNSKLSEPFTSFAVSVDSVEQLSGVDFFTHLSGSLESLEASFDPSLWVVDKSIPAVRVNVDQGDDQQEAEDRQCKGVTAAGKRCSRNAQSGSDYCWQHQP